MSLPSAASAVQERANAWSHGAGVVFGAAALWLLIVAAWGTGDPWRVTAVAIYGATVVLLFGASAAYHGVVEPKAKRVLQVVDHCAIYLLIAGTYTPFTLVPLRGPWGWSLFGAVWGLAALGIVSKLFWFGRFPALSVASYLVMGWLGVIAAGPLVAVLSPAALGWLAAGGLAYSGGVVFFVRDHRPWHHLWWHVAVLIGAGCHVMAVATLL